MIILNGVGQSIGFLDLHTDGIERAILNGVTFTLRADIQLENGVTKIVAYRLIPEAKSSDEFVGYTMIKDIPTGDLRVIEMDFQPEPYARYVETSDPTIWRCKGCGVLVYDRDTHEMWHGLITQMVSYMNRR